MIRILIKKKHDKIIEIQILGHAMYADYGKDIVCAGASSIFITTVNAILKFSKEAISIDMKKDKVCLKKLEENEIVDKLLENMTELFQELSVTYPKNITIREDV